MAYRLYRFGATQLLPFGDSQDDVAGGDVQSDGVEVAGGVTHYAYGDAIIPLRRHTINHTGIYSVDVRTNVDGLAGLLGQRLQLWRMREVDSSLQWKYARLTSFRWRRSVDQSLHAEVDCEFQAEGNWKTVSTSLFTRTGTGTRTVTNGGTAHVWNGSFYFTAASTATQTFTSVQADAGVNWTWSGLMTSGHQLRVDSGAWAVTNNGVDAYGAFTINSGHSGQRLLVYPPGTFTWTCTLSAGSGTFNFELYQEWI